MFSDLFPSALFGDVIGHRVYVQREETAQLLECRLEIL
jgi:hypothetical protein